MAWVGMGRVKHGRMTRSKERKSNDALRLLQVDRTSVRVHGHPGRHGQFQNCEWPWLERRIKKEKGNREKTEEIYIQVLLQGTWEDAFISQEINRKATTCLQISCVCGFKQQVIRQQGSAMALPLYLNGKSYRKLKTAVVTVPQIYSQSTETS